MQTRMHMQVVICICKFVVHVHIILCKCNLYNAYANYEIIVCIYKTLYAYARMLSAHESLKNSHTKKISNLNHYTARHFSQSSFRFHGIFIPIVLCKFAMHICLYVHIKAYICIFHLFQLNFQITGTMRSVSTAAYINPPKQIKDLLFFLR